MQFNHLQPRQSLKNIAVQTTCTKTRYINVYHFNFCIMSLHGMNMIRSDKGRFKLLLCLGNSIGTWQTCYPEVAYKSEMCRLSCWMSLDSPTWLCHLYMWWANLSRRVQTESTNSVMWPRGWQIRHWEN